VARWASLGGDKLARSGPVWRRRLRETSGCLAQTEGGRQRLVAALRSSTEPAQSQNKGPPARANNKLPLALIAIRGRASGRKCARPLASKKAPLFTCKSLGRPFLTGPRGCSMCYVCSLSVCLLLAASHNAAPIRRRPLLRLMVPTSSLVSLFLLPPPRPIGPANKSANNWLATC